MVWSQLAGAPVALTVDACVLEDQGWRSDMEDRHVLITNGETVAGAVFDGHAGWQVADFAANAIPRLIGTRTPGEALRAIDLASGSLRGGACAVAFRLSGQRLEVANVGDCELAQVSGNRVDVLTELHRVSNPEERVRVLQKGGLINGPYVVDPRTGDGLMPTRSLGDHEFTDVGVTSEPHEYVGTFSHGWVVAACDGLWDVMTADELPRYLSVSAQHAAEVLMREALEVRGCVDNLTVIVVHRGV